jgi:predicted enzyme related to lactoylglutathione lyase
VQADGKIDFVEFEGTDLVEVRRFYKAVFGWNFHGDDTEDASFGKADDDEAANDHEPPAPPLVVIYADDLAIPWRKVKAARAEITKAPFWIPNGWRFQFRDPAGNELAVWSRTCSPPAPKEFRETYVSDGAAQSEWCEGNQLAPANQWDVLVA